MRDIAIRVPGCGYDECAVVVGLAVYLQMTPRAE